MATKTYINMINRIQDELVNESLTVAQIKNAIGSAISDYENVTFFFNVKYGTASAPTFTTVSGQEYYTVTDQADIPNIVKIVSASTTVSGYNSPLYSRDYAWIDANQTGLATGSPQYYAYFAQSIRLYPIPDAAYKVNLDYTYKFADLVADADTNAWMNDGEEMIRQAAKYRIAMDILHVDDIAGRCRRMEIDAYDGLLEENRNRWPDPRLAMPDILNRNSYNILRGY